MKINKEWHLAHPMPKDPTLDQRIAWHLEHTRHCNCRELTPKLIEEMKKRRIKVPKYEGEA